MNRRIVLRGAAVLLAAGLAGCAGAPPTHYYRLAAVPGAASGLGAVGIGVRGISIPGYLDQSGIVKPTDAYQFDSYSGELWAEPLTDLLQGTMVQDLQQRLPAATVVSSDGAIGAPRDVLIEINVLRFDPDAAGQLTLSAQIAVKSGGDAALWLTRNFQASAMPAGAAVADTVAAMSTLWGQAADQAAAMIVQDWRTHAGP